MMDSGGINLNKYITGIGYCTRKEADELIKTKRITINGKIAKPGSRVTDKDKIKLDGQEIGGIIKIDEKKTYLIFNKPRGLVITTNKTAKNNILDYIGHEKQMLPIGKMDKETGGLMFLTDEHLSKTKIRKFMAVEHEYLVSCNHKISKELIQALEKGVVKGRKKFPKCKVTRISKVTMSVKIRNADDHMLKIMCSSQGFRVKEIHRVKVAGLTLGKLRPGKWKNVKGNDLVRLKGLFQ